MIRFFVAGAVTVLMYVVALPAADAKPTEPPPFVGGCVDFHQSACEDPDGDGWTNIGEQGVGSDPSDGTSTPEHGLLDEQTGLNTCHDRIDNDGDGRTDRRDSTCRITCGDYAGQGRCADPDHDGWKNYVEIAYSSNPRMRSSTPESSGVQTTCSDRLDNDLDGNIDSADVGCGAPDDCVDFDSEPPCEPA